MKKLTLDLKQQQFATGNLIASILGEPEDIARLISQRHATLYGRAPKSTEQKASTDGHADKFKVDWQLLARTHGTSEQTLSEIESGLLRALCDFNELTLLGVVSASEAQLANTWQGRLKVVEAMVKTGKEKAAAAKEAADKEAAEKAAKEAAANAPQS